MTDERREPTHEDRIASARERELGLMKLVEARARLGQPINVGVDVLQHAAAIRVLRALVIAMGAVSAEELAASVAEARVAIFEEALRGAGAGAQVDGEKGSRTA